MYNSIITYIGLHYSEHWQMVVILPKENVVIWFCSLHNRPYNYLKGIINWLVLFFNTFTFALVGNINILIIQYASMFVLNSALKGFDDTPQSKFKVAARWIVVKVSHLNNASSYILILCNDPCWFVICPCNQIVVWLWKSKKERALSRKSHTFKSDHSQRGPWEKLTLL